MSTAVAVVLMLAVLAYAVFAGADFGAGFWDLTAGGPERGARPRAAIDASIGPVWEANHVWLIFIFVVLWTSFPEAYASITLTLFIPLTIAALGIVLRGSSFAFRKEVVRTRDRRNFGTAFAISSVLVPYCMGAIIGGIASGRVPAGGKAGDPVHSWINPTSVLGGVLAVVVVAYLSAVYLVWDTRRAGDIEMAQYFRPRAIASAVAAGIVALAGIAVLHADATYLFGELTSRALPLVLLSALCGAGSLLLLVRDAAREARLLAVAAVASVVVSWGVAQWPYLLPQSLTVSGAASPSGTLTAVLVATGLAAVLVLPGLILLYVLAQRGLLPEDTAPANYPPVTRPPAPRASPHDQPQEALLRRPGLALAGRPGPNHREESRMSPYDASEATPGVYDASEAKPRVLFVYYSHTKQAQRVSEAMTEVLRGRGCDVTQAGIEFTDPKYAKNFTTFPFKHAVFSILPLLWPQLRKKAGQIGIPDAAQAGDYDLVCFGSPTWFFRTCMPMRSYLRSDAAKMVLSGKPFSAYVVCRRYWSVNLREVRRLGTTAGGTYLEGTRFTYEGGQVRSLLSLLSYLGSGEMRERALGIKIPRTNLKPGFGDQAAAFANQLGDSVVPAGNANR